MLQENLQNSLSGIYRHYKGGIYEIVCVAKHSETLEELAVYKRLAGDDYWARPLKMWKETVEYRGKTVSRFSYIAPDEETMDGMRLFGTIEEIVGVYERYSLTEEDRPLFFCRKTTGEVFCIPCEVGAYLDGDLSETELSEDCKGSMETALAIEKNFSDYVRLPYDGLNNEYELMTDFAARLPLPYREKTEYAMQGKGAFRRFKETIKRLDIEAEWYRYRAMRFRREAREWCDAVGINWRATFLEDCGK